MEEIYQLFYTYFLAIARWILPVLALGLIFQWIRCFRRVKYQPAVLAALVDEDGNRFPVTAYESAIGRRAVSDIVINLPSVSRKHAVLTKDDSGWRISDTGSTEGVTVNGEPIGGPTPVEIGDSIGLGEYPLRFTYPSEEDHLSVKSKKKNKQRSEPSEGALMALLSLYQLILGLELCFRYSADLPPALPVTLGGLLVCEWVYYFITRARKGSKILAEILAFFLTTHGFALSATAAPGTLFKQFAAAVLGFGMFLALYFVLKNIRLTMKLRYAIGIAAGLLLLVNLILGKRVYGSRNWLDLGFVTIQPSEFVKIAFIFTGAATLERLLTTRNFMGFLVFSGGCLGALGLMKDFGGASIFFVTMLIIIFMRSGDLKTVIAISSAAVVGGLVLISVMPHIARRFEAWRHVWQYADTSGYQQTRTLVAAASGGLLGVGGGNGYLDRVPAADTDLVFGILSEEWGAVIALCVLCCFVLLALYAVRLSKNVKSAYYAIAVCATAGMFLFQVALNAFGATDILPLTGVTMPFVSNGGSSMMASWGMMAFFKAAENKQGGGIA